METRILGRTGLEVKVLGLGTIPIIQVPKEKAVRIIHRALDKGLNYIDTARGYRDAEEKVGEVMKKRRDECYLATKVNRRDRKAAQEDLATSLKNLKTDHLDFWLLHDVSNPEIYQKVMSRSGAFPVAQAAKKAGKTRFIGISSHSLEVLVEAIKSDQFDLILTCYNVMERGPEKKVIPLAKKHNIAVAVMKPNGGGIPFRLFRRTGKRLGRKSASNLTPKDTLTYVLSNPDVGVVLNGPKLLKELEENIRIAETYHPFTKPQRQRLIDYVDSLHTSEAICINCQYCQPCPAKIPIPQIQQMLDASRRAPWEWWELNREYHKLKRDVDDCVECGRCERVCPVHLPVVERLRKAKESLGRKVEV